MTDIGTGTYTILAQVAAEALGLPLEQVRVEIGDSDYPPAPAPAARSGATNTCTAVLPRVHGAARRSCGAGKVPAEGVEAEGRDRLDEDEPNYKHYSIHAYGAQFAEVGVDADTGGDPAAADAGRFSAGRIFNAKTARSQLIGGMTFGVSMALHEEAVVDTAHRRVRQPRSGRVPGAGARRHSRDRRDHARRGRRQGQRARRQGRGRAGQLRGRTPRWRTRCSTPPGCGCGSFRSRSRRCCRGCRAKLRREGSSWIRTAPELAAASVSVCCSQRPPSIPARFVLHPGWQGASFCRRMQRRPACLCQKASPKEVRGAC